MVRCTQSEFDGVERKIADDLIDRGSGDDVNGILGELKRQTNSLFSSFVFLPWDRGVMM